MEGCLTVLLVWLMQIKIITVVCAHQIINIKSNNMRGSGEGEKRVIIFVPNVLYYLEKYLYTVSIQ